MSIQLAHKTVPYGDFNQHYIFFKNIDSADLNKLTDELSGLIYENKISLIEGVVSGNTTHYKSYNKAEKKTFGETNWPMSWLHNEQTESKLSGYYTGISGATVKTLLGSNFINKVFETAQARYCFTGEVRTEETKIPKKDQLKAVLNTLNTGLSFAGLEPVNIIRTWFYSTDIGNWNSAFNNEINSFFTKTNACSAYTNVGCYNQHQSSILGSVLALKPLTDHFQVKHIKSAINPPNKTAVPAIIVEMPNNEILLVSSKGCSNNESEAVPNISCKNQILKSLENIEALLNETKFTWKNMVRAIAYFTNLKDIKRFKQICKDKGIPASPILVTLVTLNNSALFELEADFTKQL